MKNKKVSFLKSKLLYIANKCFCAYTYDRGVNEYEKIKHLLSYEHKTNIGNYISKIGNPDHSPEGYGSSKDLYYQKACVGLRKYIENNFI